VTSHDQKPSSTTQLSDLTECKCTRLFRLVVESKESARAGVEAEGAVLVASLNLVDLAGSESVRHTGATGQRAKEGGKINQSLLSLSRVIHALSQPGTHVSFRDSKLTRLLQPSLSGNAKMAVVCCVTPSEKYIEETRSTLQFASRAKLVKTHATVNEVVDDATKLKRLKRELEQLKDKQRLSCGMSEEEGARIEYEKNNLLSRLETLQREKDQQKVHISVAT
jgi:centromeric protein E